MSATVYPDLAPFCTAPGSPAPFFSAIPRAVLALVGAGRLKRPDAALLATLLDYKGRDSASVHPSQATLAERLACSLSTVQRSLKRLVQAGLVVKCYRRDAQGHLRGLSYDLSAVLSLMPPKASKLRDGAWGASEEKPAPLPPPPSEPAPQTPPAPKRQNCSAEEEQEDVVKADSTPDPAAEALVGDLVGAGVMRRVARALVKKFGAGACRRQLLALARRRKVRDRAAALVASIQEGWSVPEGTPDAPLRSLPCSEGRRGGVSDSPSIGGRGACSPSIGGRGASPSAPSSPPPADPLDALSAEAFASLEARARAELARRMPEFVPRLGVGRGPLLVRAAMRQLLAGGG